MTILFQTAREGLCRPLCASVTSVVVVFGFLVPLCGLCGLDLLLALSFWQSFLCLFDVNTVEIQNDPLPRFLLH